jgi:hypothetical protein
MGFFAARLSAIGSCRERLDWLSLVHSTREMEVLALKPIWLKPRSLTAVQLKAA